MAVIVMTEILAPIKVVLTVVKAAVIVMKVVFTPLKMVLTPLKVFARIREGIFIGVAAADHPQKDIEAGAITSKICKLLLE